MAAINTKKHRQAYGIKLLLSNHPAVRKLKYQFRPSNHGHKVWTSSWLLVDYLKKSKAVWGKRVLDLACGWGTVGIYCAKKQNAVVTGADMDGDVYPFLKLMAETNKVTIDFRELDFDHVRRDLLKHIDVIIASDICFCDTLIDPLRRLIQRAKAASVEQVIIADPGRWPFDDLCEHLIGKRGAKLLEWESTKPHNAAGRILHLEL